MMKNQSPINHENTETAKSKQTFNHDLQRATKIFYMTFLYVCVCVSIGAALSFILPTLVQRQIYATIMTFLCHYLTLQMTKFSYTNVIPDNRVKLIYGNDLNIESFAHALTYARFLLFLQIGIYGIMWNFYNVSTSLYFGLLQMNLIIVHAIITYISRVTFNQSGISMDMISTWTLMLALIFGRLLLQISNMPFVISPTHALTLEIMKVMTSSSIMIRLCKACLCMKMIHWLGIINLLNIEFIDDKNDVYKARWCNGKKREVCYVNNFLTYFSSYFKGAHMHQLKLIRGTARFSLLVLCRLFFCGLFAYCWICLVKELFFGDETSILSTFNEFRNSSDNVTSTLSSWYYGLSSFGSIGQFNGAVGKYRFWNLIVLTLLRIHWILCTYSEIVPFVHELLPYARSFWLTNVKRKPELQVHPSQMPFSSI